MSTCRSSFVRSVGYATISLSLCLSCGGLTGGVCSGGCAGVLGLPHYPPPNDLAMLTSNVRKAVTIEDDYRAWLKQLRRVCSDVDVPLEVRGYARRSLSL
jgi:hypothetical protein